MQRHKRKKSVFPGEASLPLTMVLLLVLFASLLPDAHASGPVCSQGGMGHDQDGKWFMQPMPPFPPPPLMGGMIGPAMIPPPFPLHIRELGLDEKQRQSIRQTSTRAMKDHIRKSADLMGARLELADILHRSPMDVNAVEAKLKQIAAIAAADELSHFKAMNEIESILTPEQKIKLASIRETLPAMGRMGSCDGPDGHDMQPPEPKRQSKGPRAPSTKAE